MSKRTFLSRREKSTGIRRSITWECPRIVLFTPSITTVHGL